MFRIVSGKWKAKRISAPKNFEVRPTTDFAKEALFSILDNRYNLETCSVLDLFAGIGSISLEFASRYCQDITAVEMHQKHAAFIHETAANLGLSLQINLNRADVFDWLKKNRTKKKFDIIFADPPFETEEKKYNELISLVLQNDFLKDTGIFILEHRTKTKITHPAIFDERKYGNVSFSLFNPLASENPEL